MTRGEDSMNSKQMRAAIYTQSAESKEPGEENNALATETRLCKMHCHVQGYATDEKHIYSEIGSGNDGYNRCPQLTALLEAAKLGAFDVLVIATHNRLSRRRAVAAAIIDELQQYGVEVESIDGHNPDDMTPLVETLKGYVAETERQMINQRIKYALATKKAQREAQR
jgi:DNA invertase Pin-like site-specific DNA recombinase